LGHQDDLSPALQERDLWNVRWVLRGYFRSCKRFTEWGNLWV